MKAAAQATEYGTAAAETEAQVRVDKAGQVLARHQGLHATALEPLTPKETALTQSANFGEDLQVKLEQAQAKLKNPVRIGYGGKTLTAGLVRLVTADPPVLTDIEIGACGAIAHRISIRTGAADLFEAEIRKRVEAEAEEQARQQPLICGAWGGCGPVKAQFSPKRASISSQSRCLARRVLARASR